MLQLRSHDATFKRFIRITIFKTYSLKISSSEGCNITDSSAVRFEVDATFSDDTSNIGTRLATSLFRGTTTT
jgi:hypothetical protein